jgi:hypothetical protein
MHAETAPRLPGSIPTFLVSRAVIESVNYKPSEKGRKQGDASCRT